MKSNKKTFSTASLARTMTLVGAAALGAASAVCIALGGEKKEKTPEKRDVQIHNAIQKVKKAPVKSDEEIALEVERELNSSSVEISHEDSFLGKIEGIFSAE